MARRTARNTQRRKTKFLEAYKQAGTASEAARLTGIPRDTHTFWLKQSESYRKAFQAADDEATEVLEREALRRAVEGREEDVYWNGQVVGKVRKYSDVLLIFLLKAKRPDVYRERYDARLTANLNVQSAVKVIHEYHDSPAAIDAVYTDSQVNRAVLTATLTKDSLSVPSTGGVLAQVTANPVLPNPTPNPATTLAADALQDAALTLAPTAAVAAAAAAGLEAFAARAVSALSADSQDSTELETAD